MRYQRRFRRQLMFRSLFRRRGLACRVLLFGVTLEFMALTMWLLRVVAYSFDRV